MKITKRLVDDLQWAVNSKSELIISAREAEILLRLVRAEKTRQENMEKQLNFTRQDV